MNFHLQTLVTLEVKNGTFKESVTLILVFLAFWWAVLKEPLIADPSPGHIDLLSW